MALPPVLTHGASGIEFFSNPAASQSHYTPDPYLNGLPDPVFLLGIDGKIQQINARALSWLNKHSSRQVEGYRLHEIIPANDWQGAIGSIEGKLLSQFFRTGLIPRNVNLHLGIQGECEYTNAQDENYVLRVSLKKIFTQGQARLMLTIQDITEIKRKELLQSLFMHDLANRVTEVIANSELLHQFCKRGDLDPESIYRWSENINMISKELGLEVSAQQAVAAMELKQMSANPSEVKSLKEIEKLTAHFFPVQKNHKVTLVVDDSSKNILFSTDPVLLRRVLTNLVKNAIEASKPGDVITLGCNRGCKPGTVEFWIHNPAAIPAELREHLFKPYFSTKHSTRGLGTYSIKFLTEYFLKGSVEVDSCEETGTCFRVSYPLALQTELSA